MQSVNEIWPVYAVLQNNLFIKKSTKNEAWELVPGPFSFSKNPL